MYDDILNEVMFLKHNMRSLNVFGAMVFFRNVGTGEDSCNESRPGNKATLF